MKLRELLKFILIFIGVPAAAIGGMFLSGVRSYYAVALAVAVMSCAPFFLNFEKKNNSRELLVIAVMTAVSVAGRMIFAEIPGFKPVTAVVMITALTFGGEAGFMTGALSALISNLWFGQGPWTPFQMFGWGLTGYLTGVLRRPLKKNLLLLTVFGALMGLLYSLVLDVNTVLWMTGAFSVKRYIAAVTASFPVTLTYMVSNALFLLLLSAPFGKTLDRIKKKYGL